MQEEAVEGAETEGKKKRRLPVLLLLSIALAGVGFASTYFQLWSPLNMIPGGKAESHEATAEAVVFVDVPMIELSLPGGRNRMLVLGAKIEADKETGREIAQLMPRVSDNFNTFLSQIDPLAFDKRGVLEIIKGELRMRAEQALPGLPVKNLLITEFRLK